MKRTLNCLSKKLLITIVAFLALGVSAFAQNVSISGTVIDSDGLPLPGVNVVEKGTTNGTITQISGEYLINVPADGTLVFSFIGYEDQVVLVNGKKVIDIQLEESSIGLDEVVAVGYGVKKRSVVTGSISSLDSKDILQSRPADINQAFTGRAAGVVVSQSSGQPGSSPKITIRGVGTNGNSNPLYVIDGLPMDDMNSVNPNDIESLQVLKDATSAAIYGARAANGVILITTKKGKKGETTLTYDGFYGVQSAFNQPDLLNTDEYLMLMKEYYANDGTAYPDAMPTQNMGIDTDWLGVIASSAPVQEHNVTATMGSEKGSVLLSLGYRNQDGIIGGDFEKSFFKRYNARMNANLDINENVSIGANINFTHIDKGAIGTGTNGYNPVYYGLLMDPTTPVYGDGYVAADEKGYGTTGVPFTRMWNPMSFMDVTGNGFNRSERIYGNTYAKITFLKDFVLKTDLAANFNNGRSRSFSPIYYHNVSNYSDVNKVTQNSDRSTFWQWENTLTYTKKIGDHHITALVGTSASQNTYERLGGSRVGYPAEADTNDNFWWLNSGNIEGATNYGEANPVHTISSYFGRLSYNYQEKYMAEFVMRRDGSSNFGPKDRYAVFPGVSFGWNVSNEDFWNIENFDKLKFRASWGQNGNEAISPFSYTSTIANDRNYTLGNGSVITGSSPSNLVNPNVRWETSEQLNIGADMVFYNGKLRVSMDYYTKTTQDLLFKRTVEAVRGNSAPYYNAGEIKNSGLEFQIGYNFKVGEVDFAVNANASYLKNEVTKVGNDNGYEEGGYWKGSTNVTRMEEGKAIGYFYGYKIDGIFQNQADINSAMYPNAQPGDFKWHDTNGDGEITPDDRTDIGNPWPKWTYGMTINAKWNGLDFSMMMHGKADVDIWMAQYRDEAYGRANLPSFWLDRWQQAGDNNGVPRLSITDANDNVRKASEFHVRDASFFKIGTIELGYTLPERWTKAVNLSRVRIYTAADNVAVFTKYPMFDPEVGAMEGNILNTGLDYSMYPQARTIRFGLNVGF
ncbi:TonB-dependent receptor [Labilibaculum sp. DW002]|uniref:TonB-dependent receptor n=1 Tax=Paralabilibaculum antarcticum TaxID=2912572 RepID=A0ABT5VNE4_9BACT|nr:TonB-dependent receptor [Labilibaculum sp. DW002]MDE5416775.1 TonB-dependent receptor [Labilibaculum sp. DW002]